MSNNNGRRLHIATFTHDVKNTFDYMADQAIKQLLDENAISCQAYEKQSNLKTPKENSATEEDPLDYLIRT